MEEIVDKNRCSGCTACKSICPVNAIFMKENSEGFMMPYINQDKCINCGKCKRVCPPLNNKVVDNNVTAYAAYNNNLDVRLDSSSGGIFTLLAEYILDNGGLVIGASFDDDLLVRHEMIIDKEKLSKLRGSKYLQSNLGDIFTTIKKILEEDRLILFTGTPCQIDGLLNFLRKDYDNLYTQDIICHGVPSYKIWKKYLYDNHKGVTSVNFRNKLYGWKSFDLKLCFNENVINSVFHEDKYMHLFLNNIILRESCYRCSSKNYHRRSDITLADLWGVSNIIPKLDDNKGLSLIIVNSSKGNNLFDKLSNKMTYEKIDLDSALKYNHVFTSSVKRPKARDLIFGDLDNLSFDKLYEKYSVKNNLKVNFKKIIRKIIKK